jgi:hypothetical protein
MMKSVKNLGNERLLAHWIGEGHDQAQTQACQSLNLDGLRGRFIHSLAAR